MLPSEPDSNPLDSQPLLILVCTYNERANIERLLDAINRVVPDAHMLVIDDASPDGTSELVSQLIVTKRFQDRLTLRTRPGKNGLGSAIRDGLHFAMSGRYEFVVNLDADFSHAPEAIPSLVAAIRDRVDLVIGSRYIEGGKLVNCSWKRKFVSKLANVYARSLLGWTIRDCSSAYRCYRVTMLRKLPWNQIQCTGYGFLEEILWHTIHSVKTTDEAVSHPGSNVVESPITYTERELGDSKISFAEARGTMAVLQQLSKRRR